MTDDLMSLDYRAVVAGLTAEQRKRLLTKSDWHGLVHLAGHGVAIAILALLVVFGVWGWQLLMLPLGILIIFLFTTLHEATHGTAFQSDWLNRAVAHGCGFLVLVPPAWFKCFHFAHHRHTQDREHDPELEGGKPENWPAYLAYLSGVPAWYGNLKVLFKNALGWVSYAYLPERQRSRIIWEARLFLLEYALLFAVSILTENAALLFVWIIPLLLGQPFLRAFLLAEHARCPHVANMLENTRTTFTWPLVRFVAWNMPYHAEHHANPNVPFWKLPEFHEIAGPHLRTTEHGYGRFHRKLSASFAGISTDEAIQVPSSQT